MSQKSLSQNSFWFLFSLPAFPLWLQEAGLVLGVWVSLPGFLWEKYIINEECAISLNTQGITPFNFVSDPQRAASAGFSWHTNTHKHDPPVPSPPISRWTDTKGATLSHCLLFNIFHSLTLSLASFLSLAYISPPIKPSLTLSCAQWRHAEAKLIWQRCFLSLFSFVAFQLCD